MIITKSALLGSTIIAAAVLVASPAFAQVAPDPVPPAEDEGAQTVAEDTVAQTTSGTPEEIVVTGSRIARPELETAAPLVASIGAEELETRAITNIAQALNEVPGFGAAVSDAGDQSQFSVGQNFVNLFGIGTNRTLTLVNGRRFVSSNTASNFGGAAAGLQVDLNVIPVSLIDRVDVLAVKGAATYGSDAIAGTVNLILKNDFEGLDLRGSLGITERGDKATKYASATMGGNFLDGRGNVVFNFEYNSVAGLLANQRDITRSQLFFVAPPAGTSEFGRVLIEDRRIPAINESGIPTRAGGIVGGLPYSLQPYGFPFTSGGFTNASGQVLRFDDNGQLVPYDLGTVTGDLVTFLGGEGFCLCDTQQLSSDVERITAYSLGHFDLTDDIRLFYEGSYANVDAVELRNQPFYQSSLFGQPSAGLGILLSNPFVSDQARATLRQPQNLGTANNFDLNGDGVADEQRFFLQRALMDVANNNPNEQQLDLFRIVGGVEGQFGLGGRQYSWNLSYNHGRSQAVSQSVSLVQQNYLYAVDAVGVTQADITRLGTIAGAQAVNVIRNGVLIRSVPESQLQIGDIACRIQVNPLTGSNVPGAIPTGTPFTPVAVAGCVPLNLIGEGNALPEAINYVTTFTTSESKNTQDIFNANVGGDLFHVWTNPISFNIGFEHRREEQTFTPDAFLQEGLGRSAAISPVLGSFNTNEFYGELLAPLIQPGNNGFIHLLELDGSVRHIDHSLTGGDWIYSVGARVAPVRDITFRGSYTRSVRAPAITELFLPTVEVFSFANDPCDTRFIEEGPDPARRAANCAAHGIPVPFTSTIVSASQRINSSGDPNLESEKSKSWTVGAILQPRFVPGLTLTADWINIELTDAIQNLTLTQILRACYDSESFPNNAFCNRFSRNDIGQLAGSGYSAQVGFANAGLFEFAGLQASARYGFALGDVFGGRSDWGRMDLSARYFYLHQLDITVAGVENRNDGEIGDFTHSATGTIGWTSTAGTSLHLFGNYVSGGRFDWDDTPTSRDYLSNEDHFEMGLTFGQEVGENYRFQFTVNNLLDAEIPFPAAGANLYGIYESALLGRRYQASVFLRF